MGLVGIQACAGQSDSVHVNQTRPYLCHFSTEMAEIWSPGTFFKDIWTQKNFSSLSLLLSELSNLKWRYLVISIKSFITLKVQEEESWNFVCPNTFRKCAWRPNFSHFGWKMTKISTVPKTMSCLENDVHDCISKELQVSIIFFHCPIFDYPAFD